MLELILVIAIAASLVVTMIPMSIRYYRMEVLDEAVNVLASDMKRAEAYAFYGRLSSDFGLKFFPGEYVLFHGSTYGARVAQYDEVIALPEGVTLSGPNEIVFAHGTGVPTSPGGIIVRSADDESVITLRSNGLVDLE